MKRKDYELYKWYQVTDETYWVQNLDDETKGEFIGCVTIVRDKNNLFNGWPYIMTQQNCHIGWGTMAKYGNYEFMIIENL